MTDIITDINNSADAIDRIAELSIAAVAIQSHNDTHHIIVPEGYKHIDITKQVEAQFAAPSRKTGTAKLSSLGSFCTYVEDQDCANTAYIYADPDTRSLTAIFNDLRDTKTTGWRDHRAQYTVELSREANNWISNNKVQMGQEQFANFIEDNIADIAEPAGEVLLAIACTLQAKTDVNFASSKRLDNGQVQLTYNETISATAGSGNIEIPREFAIGIRLFKNGEGYKLKARLKYRLNGGSVKFWYELDRVENAIESEFQELVKAVQETGYTVLFGKA
jgi:uncharacterized protein YfdQ (DUF2303 family)